MTDGSYSVCVIGAGITGVYSSLLLSRLGFRVTVVEQEQEAALNFGKPSSADNVLLTQKSMSALKEVNALSLLSSSATVVSSVVLHTVNIHIIKKAFPQTDLVLWSAPRHRLHSFLLELAKSTDIRFIYNKTLLECSEDGTCTCKEYDGFTTKERFDLIVGADGNRSSVRRAMLSTHDLDYLQRFPPYVSMTFNIPPIVKRISSPPIAATGEVQVRFENEFAVEGTGASLHAWRRDDSLLTTLPGNNHSLTATLIAPLGKLTLSLVYDTSTDQVKSWFAHTFPELAPYAPDLQSYTSRAVSPFMEIRTSPCGVGNVVLLGSAAHTVVPLLGATVDVNIALWDALMLYRTIQKRIVRNTGAGTAKRLYGVMDTSFTTTHASTAFPLRTVLSMSELQHILQTYAQVQQRSMDSLADVINQQFLHLAQSQSSLSQRMRYGFEFALEKLFPTYFVPLYERLAFLDEPYEDSVAADGSQRVWVDTLAVVAVSTLGAGLYALCSCALRGQISIEWLFSCAFSFSFHNSTVHVTTWGVF